MRTIDRKAARRTPSWGSTVVAVLDLTSVAGMTADAIEERAMPNLDPVVRGSLTPQRRYRRFRLRYPVNVLRVRTPVLSFEPSATT
jgi:hypothetical protein